MQDYEAVQKLFYEECMKLTETDLTREVLYEKGNRDNKMGNMAYSRS